jgi:hypothetical protein
MISHPSALGTVIPLPATCYDFITDARIASAMPFPGYNMRARTCWPIEYRTWPRDGRDWPDSLYAAAHAYHIQQLSLIIRHVGWVGPPPVRDDVGIFDGQNRIRAIKFLRGLGVAVEIPEAVMGRIGGSA